jgi:FkbM family methyltransferase
MASRSISQWRKIQWRLAALYHRYWRKDEFIAQHRLWLAAEGDDTLRIDYPLASTSVVFDVGGYQGDFAARIRARFGCHVHLFEPLPRFYRHCLGRFAGDPAVACHHFGLGDREAYLEMRDDADASGAFNPASADKPLERVRIRPFGSVFAESGASRIDLLKVNIEGGEFPLLENLISTGLISKVEHLQVQFHNFVPDAVASRDRLRRLLSLTHSEQWNYPFIWESWKRRP